MQLVASGAGRGAGGALAVKLATLCIGTGGIVGAACLATGVLPAGPARGPAATARAAQPAGGAHRAHRPSGPRERPLTAARSGGDPQPDADAVARRRRRAHGAGGQGGSGPRDQEQAPASPAPANAASDGSSEFDPLYRAQPARHPRAARRPPPGVGVLLRCPPSQERSRDPSPDPDRRRACSSPLLGAPAAVSAGSYTVSGTCGLWAPYSNNGARMAVYADGCRLVTRNTYGGFTSPQGTEGGWRMSAPAGASIAGFSIKADLKGTSGWDAAVFDDAGLTLRRLPGRRELRQHQPHRAQLQLRRRCPPAAARHARALLRQQLHQHQRQRRRAPSAASCSSTTAR